MKQELSPSIQKLVLHWGEMGSRWGLNRSISQIYALLFFTQQTMTADEIAGHLSLARSNISTSIRELQDWGVIKLVQKMGDRRDHYQALDDAWETLQRIGAMKRKRELDPTISLLRDTLKEMESAKSEPVASRRKVADLLRLFQLAATWDDEFQRYAPTTLAKLSGMASEILKLIHGIVKPEKKTGR